MLQENPYTGDIEYVAEDLTVHNILTGECIETDVFDEDDTDFSSYSAFIDEEEEDEFC